MKSLVEKLVIIGAQYGSEISSYKLNFSWKGLMSHMFPWLACEKDYFISTYTSTTLLALI